MGLGLAHGSASPVGLAPLGTAPPPLWPDGRLGLPGRRPAHRRPAGRPGRSRASTWPTARASSPASSASWSPTRWATTSPARYYGVDATLPFFIPFPLPGVSLVGTLGAFIRIRGPIPHRRALFDIGVAGPLAGFVVCLPVLWLGVREAAVQPLLADAGGHVLRRAARLPVGGPPRPRPHPRRPDPRHRTARARRLVRPVRDRPQPHADRPARRRPRHVRAPARARASRLEDRLVGLRGARLLRPELDPLGHPRPRPRPAPPLDPRRRGTGRPRRGCGSGSSASRSSRSASCRIRSSSRGTTSSRRWVSTTCCGSGYKPVSWRRT